MPVSRSRFHVVSKDGVKKYGKVSTLQEARYLGVGVVTLDKVSDCLIVDAMALPGTISGMVLTVGAAGVNLAVVDLSAAVSAAVDGSAPSEVDKKKSK
jgi:hypothetical protein